MDGHLRIIVGALQTAKVAVPVIPEVWNDAIQKVPVTSELAVSEGGLLPSSGCCGK